MGLGQITHGRLMELQIIAKAKELEDWLQLVRIPIPPKVDIFCPECVLARSRKTGIFYVGYAPYGEVYSWQRMDKTTSCEDLVKQMEYEKEFRAHWDAREQAEANLAKAAPADKPEATRLVKIARENLSSFIKKTNSC